MDGTLRLLSLQSFLSPPSGAATSGAGSAAFAFTAASTGGRTGAGSVAFAFNAAAGGAAFVASVGVSSYIFTALAASSKLATGAGASSFIFIVTSGPIASGFAIGPLFTERTRLMSWGEDMRVEVKRPAEDRAWNWDFRREPELTEQGLTISSVMPISITTVEAPEQPDVQPTVGTPAIGVGSNAGLVSVFISDGTDGNQYQLDCEVLLSDSTSRLVRSGLLLVSSTAEIE